MGTDPDETRVELVIRSRFPVESSCGVHRRPPPARILTQRMDRRGAVVRRPYAGEDTSRILCTHRPTMAQGLRDETNSAALQYEHAR